MGRNFRSVVSASVLLAACSFSIPAAAAPLSVSATAFAGLDTGASQAEPVASRRKPVRSTAKSRKSGVRVTTGDVNGDGTPDVVTAKPKPTKPTSKPTGANKPATKPTSTGGVYVQ